VAATNDRAVYAARSDTGRRLCLARVVVEPQPTGYPTDSPAQSTARVFDAVDHPAEKSMTI